MPTICRQAPFDALCVRPAGARVVLIHPVSTVRLPIPFERQYGLPGHTRLDAHGPVFVAARQLDVPQLISCENARMGMMKPVAIAYLKYRDERLDGIEERLGRRGLAAMVRHEQNLRAQRVAIARKQAAFDRRSMSAASSALTRGLACASALLSTFALVFAWESP
jgi:hypothetical protein